jgi:hypothetical protein
LTELVGGAQDQQGADLPQHPLRCGDLVHATRMVDQQLDAGPQQSRFCARWSILHKPEDRKKIPALYFRDLLTIDTGHLADGGSIPV